ncbi:foldase protein PrsA [Clostridium puniceum]|uniref:peptidylprolyl isomerase n=1 Tax=Clostridium puniceum TaxID=29367 RepID=A0A1S8THN5_9CLOT|nr:SurA N-terminal domain-containing protein [Clostridium puniceum]OOM77303.1 foldase protein PrsA [Clostridium puniceum]
MKRLKKIIVAISILIITVLTIRCNIIEKTPEVMQKTVIATVGKEKITKEDFDKEISKYDAQLKKQFGDDYETNDEVKDELKQMKEKRLDDMINGKILLIKATQLNIKPSDDDINKQIDQQMKQINARYAQKEQFESALQQSGMTEDTLKESMKTQIITNVIQNYMVKDVTVTDDEVQVYYNENKDSKFSLDAEVTPLDQVKDQIKSLLLKQKQGVTYNSKLQEWKTDLKVKIYEDKL